MRNVLVAAVFALSFVSSPAFPQDVKVDYDRDFDFSKIKTFTAKIGTEWGNPLGEKRVMGELEAGLTERGWTKAEEGKADAIVILHGATDKKRNLNTFYSGGFGGYGWRGWGGGMGTATTSVSEYMVGTMVVDIFDAKTKQLVFRGTAQDELSDKPEKNVKKVQKAGEKMFKDFPPGTAKK